MAIVDKKKQLTIQYSTSAWYDGDFWYLYSKSQDSIYDLIKADLVEKVEDKGE